MNQIMESGQRAAGRRGGEIGAALIRDALRAHGEVTVVMATGASQFELLNLLVHEPDIAWNRVTAFHLDEYIGLPIAHPASFRKYLWERFHRRLPIPLRAFHYLDGEADPETERRRAGDLIRGARVDVAFVGVGENGHLAFNDPPADFETDEPFLVVTLDEACRRQQLGEGWFPTLEDVPRRALSMSIRQILAARAIVCTVPERRKAAAVRRTVEGPVTSAVPASILQRHANVTMILDRGSASALAFRP